MNRRSQSLLYLTAMILIGIVLLIDGVFTLEKGSIQLPGIYLKIVSVELVIMAFATLIFVIGLIGIMVSDQKWLSNSLETLGNKLEKTWIKLFLLITLGLIGFIAGQMLLQIPTSKNPLTSSFLLINRPFFSYLVSLSLVSLISLSFRLRVFQSLTNPDVKVPILVFLLLALIIVGIDLSRFGFQKTSPGSGSFRLTGFPILDYQIILPWIAVMAGSLLFSWIWSRWRRLRELSPLVIDFLVGSILFAGAFFIWQSAPIIANAFIDQPRPPNFQFYPNLDAVVYDRTALNLLASGRLQTYIGGLESVGRRPLFAVYLAGLHWISGGDYSLLTSLQLGFMAILPVLIYLVTKTLHNRTSGILTAVVIIIRNLNGVWLQEDVWGGTSLQMLMSDILATIVVVLFLYLTIKWLKNDQGNPFLALIIGGILGLGMLIRQELLVLLPVVVLVGFLKSRELFWTTFRKLLIVLAGLVIVISPWMVRNFLKTGQVYLDKPGKVANLTSETVRGFFPGQEDNQVPAGIDAIIPNPESDNLPEGQSDPASPGILSLMANHYANAITQNVLYLPNNPVWIGVDYIYRIGMHEIQEVYGGLFYSPYSYAKTLPYWWWDQWNGKIASQSWIYLLFNIGLISIGFYQSWKKDYWQIVAALLTLAALISVYVLIRRSGGRFLQTVDWISVMFLCIGLVYLAGKKVKHLWGKELSGDMASALDEKKLNLSHTGGWIIFSLIFIIGTSPVLAELVLPNQYPESSREKQLTQLLAEENQGIDQQQKQLIQSYLEQGGEVLYGEALYPIYYPADAALMTENQTLFPASTTFTIAGSELSFVVLPQPEGPDWFPQGTETLVIGCRESSIPPDPGFPCLGCLVDEFEALAVILYDTDHQLVDVLWHEAGDTMRCPERVE